MQNGNNSSPVLDVLFVINATFESLWDTLFLSICFNDYFEVQVSYSLPFSDIVLVLFCFSIYRAFGLRDGVFFQRLGRCVLPTTYLSIHSRRTSAAE